MLLNEHQWLLDRKRPTDDDRAKAVGERARRDMLRLLVLVAAVFALLAAAATAARDPLTGVWVAHDVAGDGSTDRFIFSGPNADGVRSYTLIDSYGTFCETTGEGTGSVLTASGTAYLNGSAVHTTTESFVCANGTRGVFDPPLTGEATLTEEGLDWGYYIADRVGS
jgi:hypothetical protein